MLVFNFRRLGMFFFSGFSIVFSETVDSMDGANAQGTGDCANTASALVSDVSLYAIYFEETSDIFVCEVLSPLTIPLPSKTVCCVLEEAGGLAAVGCCSEIDLDWPLGFSRFMSFKFCQIKE